MRNSPPIASFWAEGSPPCDSAKQTILDNDRCRINAEAPIELLASPNNHASTVEPGITRKRLSAGPAGGPSHQMMMAERRGHLLLGR